MVNPWGVEPQSKEPESFILSIELRVQVTFCRRMCLISPDKVVSDEMRGKITVFFVTLQGSLGKLGAVPLCCLYHGLKMALK